MDAQQFFANFRQAFESCPPPVGTKAKAGKAPGWSVPVATGKLDLELRTDFKGAGLLKAGLWPGEFRLKFYWITGRGATRRRDYVSFFQYTTGAECDAFAAIQRDAVAKFLQAGGQDPYGSLRDCINGDFKQPKPNFDTFYYFFDDEDARRWGDWYGALLPTWLERFEQAPESNEEWAWRVLWPHLTRKPRPES